MFQERIPQSTPGRAESEFDDYRGYTKPIIPPSIKRTYETSWDESLKSKTQQCTDRVPFLEVLVEL